jgi:hypothetical protein
MVAEDKEIWIDFKANVVSVKLNQEYKKTLCILHSQSTTITNTTNLALVIQRFTECG